MLNVYKQLNPKLHIHTLKTSIFKFSILQFRNHVKNWVKKSRTLRF